MASTVRMQTVRGKRWLVLAGSVAFGATTLGLAGSGIGVASASTDGPSSTAVVECTSGTVTQGDVQTSSRVATRVTADQLPDTPGGCTVKTG